MDTQCFQTVTTQQPTFAASASSTTIVVGDNSNSSSSNGHDSNAKFLSRQQQQQQAAAATLASRLDQDLATLVAAGNLSAIEEQLADTTTLDPDRMQSGTGLRPLHFAASRGYLDIVTCLIEKAGATVDATDKEGETALLKAAYAGHMTIVEYLVIKAQADTTHQDKDGWRALHNACSRGHLPMVQFLVECGAPVNARSRIGNTPLINAASKGNTAVVEYLLNEAEADPLLHNEFGETAYDAAAAIGSVYLCELLEAAERACWVDPIRGRDGPYDPLSIHVTVPVLIHENQRAVTSLLRGLGKQLPTFSSSALSKNDRRSAWSLYPSGKPTTRGHVKLPPLDRNASWFWLTDWTVDYSHPKSDNEGWQYGKSFEYTDDEEWTAAIPTSGAGWVRRRRWMRIMKRRVDHQQQQLESAAASGGQVIIAGAREQEVQTGESNSLMGGTTTTTDQGGHDHLRLVERQEQASGSSHTSNNNSGSSSNSTVGMSLTKAQSVFVGCTTHVQSVETAAAAAAGAGATEPEPSPRQSSLELTRASVRSSIASSHSCHVQPHYYHHHHHHRPTYVWERNEQAAECRRCGRWFNLLVRRHHCRRCGLVVCDKCSTKRSMLPFSHSVVDPAVPLEQHYLVSLQPQRVCDGCFDELSRPRAATGGILLSRQHSRTNSIIINTMNNNNNGSSSSSSSNNNNNNTSRPSSMLMRRTPSAQSVMMECPVCGADLEEYGSTSEQEVHVRTCLNANTPAALSGIRYVVYKLPSNSALVGQECVICLEEYVEGNTMARLNCLCTFHHGCIHSWFAKGKECPLHSQ